MQTILDNLDSEDTENNSYYDNDVINTFMINHLDQEYKKYSQIIYKLQTHIETINTLHIIDYSCRNCYLKILNNIIKLLNLTYNDNLKEFDDDNIRNNPFNDYIIKSYKMYGENIYTYGHDLLSIYKPLTSPNLYFSCHQNDKFKNILDVILHDVCAKVGFNSIKLACELLNLKEYSSEEFNLYNKIFVPLNYNVIENNINQEDIKQINEIYIITNALKYDNLNEYGKLYLKVDSTTYYAFDGYFKIDTLNVIRKTCQITYPHLFDKIKSIELQLKNTHVPESFYKNYIKNNSIAHIIMNDVTDTRNIIIDKYDDYNNIHNMSLTDLIRYIEDIDETNIEKFHDIIKLILLKSCDKEKILDSSDQHDHNTTICDFISPIFETMKNNNTMLHDKALIEILYKYFSFDHQLKLKHLISKGDMVHILNIATNTNDNSLKKKIKDHKFMPYKVKKVALDKFKEMKAGNGNEYYKQSMYIKTLLKYPWPTPDDDIIFTNLKSNAHIKGYLENVMKKLDETIYGHVENKKSIVELIGKWISNPNSSGYSFGLCGPAGIGKTLFAKAIGRAMGIPFTQITLGGQNDGELLHGHGYTYSGSQPGMIVKKMIEAGNSRCIMYFDELDKACKKHDSNEIFNILVHITDPNMNSQFQDRFFQEINFPLNKVLFIFSYNDTRLIDNILMDRIKKLEIKPFKIGDKRQIVKKFILPEMCKEININMNDVIIQDSEIDYVIENYTKEPGVRDLKRAFEMIFQKLNIDIIYGNYTNTQEILLSNKIITGYLGECINYPENIHVSDIVGVINGLYATESWSGGILPIEVYYNKIGTKVMINLTGSQKRVMQESVKTAYTVATNIVNPDRLANYMVINPYGLHIHTPSCAVPKDGPSASAAFTIAIISRILSKKIRNNVSITGEINLRGGIMKIGGLVHKLNGAKKAGIELVLVSEENKTDINNILKDDPTLCSETFKVLTVSNIMEALSYTLVDFSQDDFVS